jgi:hypothetical protein
MADHSSGNIIHSFVDEHVGALKIIRFFYIPIKASLVEREAKKRARPVDHEMLIMYPLDQLLEICACKIF